MVKIDLFRKRLKKDCLNWKEYVAEKESLEIAKKEYKAKKDNEKFKHMDILLKELEAHKNELKLKK